jgi:hypothetical protein
MRPDLNHLRGEATRARWWAVSVFDPRDRERLEAIAREYERMVRGAETRLPSENEAEKGSGGEVCRT